MCGKLENGGELIKSSMSGKRKPCKKEAWREQGLEGSLQKILMHVWDDGPHWRRQASGGRKGVALRRLGRPTLAWWHCRQPCVKDHACQEITLTDCLDGAITRGT